MTQINRNACRHYVGLPLTAPWRGHKCAKGWTIPQHRLDALGCTRESTDVDACLFRDPMTADEVAALEARAAEAVAKMKEGTHG